MKYRRLKAMKSQFLSLVLLWGTVLLVLIVLTGCTSTETIEPEQDNYQEVLKGMIPLLPEIPSFPELSWSFENNKYSISESDVDKLLDYGENKIPLYKFELDLYKRQLDIVLQQL